MLYERLLAEADQLGLEVYEQPMQPTLKGLYADGVIWINQHIPTMTQKACILAEELGHYHTTAGNALDQTDVVGRKQERLARAWAYQRLVPLESFIRAHHAGVSNAYEMAEYLCVDEEFLQDALTWYQEKYGLYVRFGNYTIYFDPPKVVWEAP